MATDKARENSEEVKNEKQVTLSSHCIVKYPLREKIKPFCSAQGFSLSSKNRKKIIPDSHF